MGLIDSLSVGGLCQNISFYTLLVMLFLVAVYSLDKPKPNRSTSEY